MAITLVTGGAGFIGSNLVERLVERGETVRVLDDFSTGNAENLAGLAGRVTVHRGDIRNLDEMRPIIAGANYVVHLAASTSVARSVSDPLTCNSVNITGTLNVLLAARDAGVKRVIFAASAAAYGDHPQLPRVETQEPCPLSPYALSKVAGEYYCRLFWKLYGLETVALRFFNIFGPRQNPDSPYSGVLSTFISSYLRGKTPAIFGDGEQSRDFTFVANVVDATLRAVAAPEAAGRVINVGIGVPHTLNQTVALLNKILGREVTPKYSPARAGDVRYSHAKIDLARSLLGYEPSVDFEEGLRRTIEWQRAAFI